MTRTFSKRQIIYRQSSEIDGEEKFVSVVALGARQQGNPVDGQSKLFSLSEIPSKQLISCMTQIISFPLSAIPFL
jgi:hypothetical protein